MRGENKKRVQVIGSEIYVKRDNGFRVAEALAAHLRGNSCRPESTDRVTSDLLQLAVATEFLQISVTRFRCFVLQVYEVILLYKSEPSCLHSNK